MGKVSVTLEEKRLENIHDISEYNMFHERHRIFPAVFEHRNHKRILDIAAGMGIVGDRIKKDYDADLICNDISPRCLQSLQKLGITTSSFDLDSTEMPFPFPEKEFDAVVALAIIEHLINIDNFIKEIRRMLKDDGCLYLSAPNYSGLTYLIPMLASGKTFHDPIAKESRYEFYAHLRYFTYRTLLEYVSSFGFTPIAVYVGAPKSGTRYVEMKSRSKMKAFAFKSTMNVLYRLSSPRWAAEPVICFQKSDKLLKLHPRKVIL